MPESNDSVSHLQPVSNEGSFTNQSLHDVTLQRLDTSLPYPGAVGGRLKYAVENFSGTEQAWDRTLAVFVPPGAPVQHVDYTAFSNDPHREAARLGYRIVGHHADTRVIENGPGEPRAVTKAIFTDPEVDRYATEGKLSLSTGFVANISPEGIMSGKVVPNHVLYFLRNQNTINGKPAAGNDTGAMVNNLSESTMGEDSETKSILTKILDAVSQKPVVEVPVGNVEDPRIAKLTADLNALTQERDALKSKMAVVENLQVEQAKVAAETRWTQVKNLYQPALFHKEKEAVERTAFEADNAGWMLAHVGNLATAKATPAQGASAVGNLGGDEAVDVGKERGKLNPLTGRFE
jgi:hypothetical protein